MKIEFFHSKIEKKTPFKILALFSEQTLHFLTDTSVTVFFYFRIYFTSSSFFPAWFFPVSNLFHFFQLLLSPLFLYLSKTVSLFLFFFSSLTLSQSLWNLSWFFILFLVNRFRAFEINDFLLWTFSLEIMNVFFSLRSCWDFSFARVFKWVFIYELDNYLTWLLL